MTVMAVWSEGVGFRVDGGRGGAALVLLVGVAAACRVGCSESIHCRGVVIVDRCVWLWETDRVH